MKEELLQFIWQFQLFDREDLKTISGDRLEILKVGNLNTDAGPDFLNAQVKIENTLWIGNVEIHEKASSWDSHKHSSDEAYNNVILHVVKKSDKQVKTQSGQLLPTFELPVEEKLLSSYRDLQLQQKWLACEDRFLEVDEFFRNNWLNRLLIERLEEKSILIEEELLLTQNNWEETFYRLLAKNFGFKLNAEPFLQLARSLPLKLLAKHKNDSLQIEALLFGQAGLLEKPRDEYSERLKKEYSFLSRKYNFKPIYASQWKFFRVRPSSFPSIRIAQFAQLIHQSSHLLSRSVAASDLDFIRKAFKIKLSSYWEEHYRLGIKHDRKSKYLGASSVNNVLINTVLPFLFLFGKKKLKTTLSERAIEWYDLIPAEKNQLIKQWGEIGVEPVSARETQALIQLKNSYCSKRKCLNCHIGHKLLRT